MEITNIESNKNKFIELYRTNIARHGSDELLKWLETETDFFIAPASTKYHDAVDGGLCKHSLEVYNYLMKHGLSQASIESKTIVSLLHDLAKTNFYKKSFRNVKDELTGQWRKEPCYIIQDQNKLGHGSGAVIMIQRFMPLTTEEAQAILCHMSGFSEDQNLISSVFSENQLAVELSIADLRSTCIK